MFTSLFASVWLGEGANSPQPTQLFSIDLLSQHILSFSFALGTASLGIPPKRLLRLGAPFESLLNFIATKCGVVHDQRTLCVCHAHIMVGVAHDFMA